MLAIVKIKVVKEGSIPYGDNPVTNSANVASLVRRYLDDTDREQFIVLCLDGKHKPVAIHTVSIGSLSMSLVHPREVFKVAITTNSHALILVHNHPSGDPAPSAEDRVF